MIEESIAGRYASVLFTTASRSNALYHVYGDMKYLKELHKNIEQFRMVTMNAGIGPKEVAVINQGLKQTGDIQDVTLRFIEVLAENKRFMLIDEIADKYMKLYSTLNKEEKITIISAQALTKAEEGEVLSALKANPDNSGKSFTLEFQVGNSFHAIKLKCTINIG